LLDNRLTDGGEFVSLTRQPPFTPRKIPGNLFCYRLSRNEGHSATGRIRQIEKSNDLIGNRTRGLPACSIVLNQLRYRVPHIHHIQKVYFFKYVVDGNIRSGPGWFRFRDLLSRRSKSYPYTTSFVYVASFHAEFEMKIRSAKARRDSATFKCF
jgi:hypothetical protein